MQDRQIALQLGERFFHGLRMLFQQGFACRHTFRRIAKTAQFGVTQHVTDRQTGGAQFQQKAYPLDIFIAKQAMRIAASLYRIEQTYTFVIAQGVHTEPGRCRRLLYGHGSGHGCQSRSSSAL